MPKHHLNNEPDNEADHEAELHQHAKEANQGTDVAAFLAHFDLERFPPPLHIDDHQPDPADLDLRGIW